MDEETVNRFSRFRLKETEDQGVVLCEDDVEKCKEECSRSILGKIWGRKAANFTGLKSTLNQLWCRHGDLKIIELGFNYYQFIFTDVEEKDRVLMKKPWFFDHQLLIVQPWKPKLRGDDQCFSTTQIWVQVRGLPSYWSSKEVGWKLGKLFLNCLNVIFLENGSRHGKVLKLLVEINLNTPLLRGTRIKLGNEMEWVDFKYEQLPSFCFYCGIIGHQEKDCETKMSDSREDKICEGQYGEWLRVSFPRGMRKGSYGESESRKQGGLGQNQNLGEGTSKEGNGGGIWEHKNVKEGAMVVSSMTVGKEPILLDTTSKESNYLKGQENGVGINIRDSERVGDTTKSSVKDGDEKGTGLIEEIDQAANADPIREMMVVEKDLDFEEQFQGVLREVDQNLMGHRTEGGKEGRIEKVGRWKRQIRSGSGEQRGGFLRIKDEQDQNGKRKAIQQVGNEMVELDQIGIGKRQKSQNKENADMQTEVGVASREWPQINK